MIRYLITITWETTYLIRMPEEIAMTEEEERMFLQLTSSPG